jgi:hypothetical protein
MFEALRPWWTAGVVALGVIVGASWSLRRRWEMAHTAAMAVCAVLGVWAFTQFGAMHDHGALGHRNWHPHDTYHYYFGTKYLKECGYLDMYVATVAALEELGREEPQNAIRFERIRDLRQSSSFLTRAEFAPLEPAVRDRFTAERWQSLKTDLSFLRSKVRDGEWWKKLVLDAGFNPPPTYAVIGGAVSNRLPFNEATWRWLGGMDFVLIGIGVSAIAWALGVVPALFCLVILGNAPVATYVWTGGSFLRQIWLVAFMVGLAALARRRWFLAGVALGAATAVAVFPGFFLFGALLPLVDRFRRTRFVTPIVRLLGGATISIAILTTSSVVAYGWELWHEWIDRIATHSPTLFTNYLGFQKIATFAPEAAAQNFNIGTTLFHEWNGALLARAQRMHTFDVLLRLLLSIWTIAAAVRTRVAEASLVVGSVLLVLWTMPAGYYTIYVGVLAAFFLANRRSRVARKRFIVVAVALVSATVMAPLVKDLIVEQVLLSVGWIVCLVTISSMSWLESPPFPQTRSERVRTISLLAAISLTLFAVGLVSRNTLQTATFLPPTLLGNAHIVDVLDLGMHQDEVVHNVRMDANALRVTRTRMDTYGYRVNDDARVLRSPTVIHYDLSPSGRGSHLVIRTDSFFRGELLTTVNGRSLPPVHLEPRQTLFAYLEVPLPDDIDGEPLHVVHATTASDVGLFTIWSLAP